MRKVLIILLILGLLLGVFYFVPMSFPPLTSALIHALEKRFDARIECESVRLRPLDSLSADGIKIKGVDGVSLFIKKGAFSYKPISLITTARLSVGCRLSDVSVYGDASILELVTDLLSIKSLEDIKFHEIKGNFFIGRNDTVTQGLTGTGKDIMFVADGVTRRDNSINLRLRLLLNDSLSASIPKDIRRALLKKEEGPWSSLLIGITGNYKKPSLRLLNKLFRLDITAK